MLLGYIWSHIFHHLVTYYQIIKIWLHYVPGHCCVIGSEVAYKLGQVRLEDMYLSSVTSDPGDHKYTHCTTSQLLTPLMFVCVNFICECRDLQFTLDWELQIFEKLFHGKFYSNTPSFCQKFADRKSKKYTYFFPYFIWMSKPGYEPRLYL